MARAILGALLSITAILTIASVGFPTSAQGPAADRSALTPNTVSPFFPNIKITDGSSPYQWQVEPTMVINSSGEVFVGWKETNGPEAAGLRTGYAHSSDGGWSWSSNVLMPQAHPNQGCHNSDPWMSLAPNGKLNYAYLEYDCGSGLDVVNTSNGNDWGTVHYLQGNGGLVDKDSIAHSTSGRLYATWDEGNVLAITWSDDGGATWAPRKDPADTPGGVLGAIVATSPDGSKVYLTWWNFGTNNILFDWSGDGGQTWHTDVKVNDQSGSAMGSGWKLPLPAMFVDKSSGTIYVSWMDNRNGNFDIYMASSSNGGLTWSTNHKINDDTGTAAQWMVDLAVDSTGKVHAAWEDDRNGNHDIYYSNSTDSGSTWSANVRVTTQSTPISFTRPGDYFSIRTGPNNAVYIVWTDGRGSDYDIYFARSPGFNVASVTVATDPAALKVTVDGQSLTAPVQKYWLVGSTHAVGTTSPQIVGKARYLWLQWSDGGGITHNIQVASDVTLTAKFKTQYLATFATDPGGLLYLVDNTSYNQSTSLWWDKGTTHWLDVPSPQANGSNSRYAWSKWSDGGAKAHAVKAISPFDATASFQEEQTLKVDTSPAGLTYYVNGFSYSTPATFWLPLGTYHEVNVDSPQAGSEGVRYTFANWSDGKAAKHVIFFQGTMSLTARFGTEYFLTIASPVAGTSGSGWYAAGSTARASAPPTGDVRQGERLAFQGWSGDASGKETTSNPITMNGPKTAVANYGTQYYLDVRSERGTTSGSGWYASGATAQAGVQSSEVPSGSGTRYLFTSWSGDAAGSGTTSNVLMDRPKVAVANWKVQYYLTIESPYGKATTQGWYDAGASVKAVLDVSNVQLAPGVRATFLAWSLDATGNDPSGSATITMDGPRKAVATWHTEYQLRVETQYGTVSGSGWYAAGTRVVVSLNANAIAMGQGERVAFIKWIGDGDGSNASASDPIIMDKPKTVTALWQRQFQVSVASDLGSVEGSGWYEAGSSVTLLAPREMSSGGRTYAFAGWRGDISSQDVSLTFTVDKPVSVRATWTVVTAVSPMLTSPLSLVLVGGLIALAAAVVAGILVVRRRRRRR